MTIYQGIDQTYILTISTYKNIDFRIFDLEDRA